MKGLDDKRPLNHVRLPSKMNTETVFSGVYARQGRGPFKNGSPRAIGWR